MIDIARLRTLITECERSERNGGYNLRADRAILRALPELLDEVGYLREIHAKEKNACLRITELEDEVERLRLIEAVDWKDVAERVGKQADAYKARSAQLAIENERLEQSLKAEMRTGVRWNEIAQQLEAALREINEDGFMHSAEWAASKAGAALANKDQGK